MKYGVIVTKSMQRMYVSHFKITFGAMVISSFWKLYLCPFYVFQKETVWMAVVSKLVTIVVVR